jgi:sulfur-carrier protein
LRGGAGRSRGYAAGDPESSDEIPTGPRSKHQRMRKADSESEAKARGTVTVCVHGPLRKLAAGRGAHELEGETVLELLRGLESRHPELRGWILDERGRIRRHINVFVGGERGEELMAVRPGDRVEVLPAITGG